MELSKIVWRFCIIYVMYLPRDFLPSGICRKLKKMLISRETREGEVGETRDNENTFSGIEYL